MDGAVQQGPWKHLPHGLSRVRTQRRSSPEALWRSARHIQRSVNTGDRLGGGGPRPRPLVLTPTPTWMALCTSTDNDIRSWSRDHGARPPLFLGTERATCTYLELLGSVWFGWQFIVRTFLPCGVVSSHTGLGLNGGALVAS